ncbi:glycosyltransferase [Phenylobacterium sp.]|uniref:glycosyltransferase family protein n=1 Tax=Phenylobacterium sp. TaxID=1871053 RepID=UPI001208D63B|nr:glycosyltransferase [Phenylobacterium sp.]THD70282.1 MAG: glycosyltransferase family 1 protein [Phenylobacterium sp.]
MRILIMKGQSQYGGTRLFADLAAQAFQRRGHEVDILDLGATDNGGMLILAHAQTSGPVDLIFTINICGEFIDSAGRRLTDLYGGAPHVIWHVDYVLGQGERLRATPSNTAVLVVDPTQADAVRAIYGVGRFKYLGFFPHPAVGSATPDDATAAEFAERRPIQVLWSGSFQQPEAERWMGVQGAAREVMQEALDMALAVEWVPPHQALDAVLRARGLDLANPAIRGAREAAALVHTQVRTTRRFEFLKAVAESGVPLHIVGAGWENQLDRFKNVTFEGPVEMTRMAELMAQSRVVLNTNVNFGAGSHERPFSASLAGAATFSDFSRYYAQVFQPGKTIELFYWRDLKGGMEKLKALASDPERAFEYARGAKATTLAGHTWDQRIDLILQAGEAVR